MRAHLITIACTSLVVACASGEARESGPSREPEAVTGTVVDSIFPLDEALRRFRIGIPEVAMLGGTAPSRDALIDQFVSALESRDTAAFRQMVLSRAEFAWLYYPTSTFSREPFYQMPQLTWFLNIQDSEKGLTRVMERFGGAKLKFSAYESPDTARTDGGLSFWDRCLVDFVHKGTARRLRLFGSIVELGGRYKFYSYANDL